MVLVFVNNQEVSVQPNTSVLKACESQQIEIPRFCYHKKLSIAGNCRMCLVEIEKSPKPVVSCAMPVMEGMRIFTDTPLVKKARENVLEFLLLNHPLDCPVCDQGGECDLQEQALSFGSDQSRFYDLKRGVHDKKIGPLIKTIMTRCIHCTRCVRFATEVAGVEELGTTIRGTETEIGTYIEKLFRSELSGNVIDLCPVGALTSKPYAFKARPWELKTENFVDISDGLGSPVKADMKGNEIIRVTPYYANQLDGNFSPSFEYDITSTESPFVDEWISDKARFSYDAFQSGENSLFNQYNKSSVLKIEESVSDLVDNMISSDCFNFSLKESSSGIKQNFSGLDSSLNFLIDKSGESYLRDSLILNVSNSGNKFGLKTLLDFQISLKDSENLLENSLLKFKNEDPLFVFGDLVEYDTLAAYNYSVSSLNSKISLLGFKHLKKVNFNSLSVNSSKLWENLRSPIEFTGVSSKECFVKDFDPESAVVTVSNSLLERQRTNVSLANLESADLCLLIGVNPRYESSLYNLHLRKRLALGGFEMASIGPSSDLTYPIDHLGLGTETLKALCSGKHPFFNKMLKAKKPVILLGSQLHKSPDFSLIEDLALNLGVKVGAIPSKEDFNNVKTQPWLGYGTLQGSVNSLGQFVLGIKGLNELDTRKHSRLVFLLGLDPVDLVSLRSKNKVINSDTLVPVMSTLENSKVSVFSDITKTVNYPVVSSNYVERSHSSFLTTEGKLKQVERLVKPASFKQDSSEFLISVFDTVLKTVEKRLSVCLKDPNLNSSFEKSKLQNLLLDKFDSWRQSHYSLNFPNNMMKTRGNLLKLNLKPASYKNSSSVYNSLVEDFYLTDSLRLSSNRMRRCSSLNRKRVTNFSN